MTITKVQIFNSTLIHLGVTPNIEGEAEDTKKRIVLESVWDFSRRKVLKAHDWGFAKRVFNLVEVGIKPDSWAHQYKKPNSMLKPRFIQNTDRRADRLAFTNATYEDDDNGKINVIWTDVSNALMIGTEDIIDPALMTDECTEAISAYMAFRTARNFTDSKSIKDQAFEYYRAMLAEGAQIDALSEAEDPEQEADWIRARGGNYQSLPPVIRGT